MPTGRHFSQRLIINVYLVLFIIMVLTYTHLVLLLVLNHLVLLQDVYLHLDIFYTHNFLIPRPGSAGFRPHSHGLLTQHYNFAVFFQKNMATLRATNIFSKNNGRASRDRYFLQNFTWLSKFHLPPVGIIQLIYRGGVQNISEIQETFANKYLCI